MSMSDHFIAEQERKQEIAARDDHYREIINTLRMEKAEIGRKLLIAERKLEQIAKTAGGTNGKG